MYWAQKGNRQPSLKCWEPKPTRTYSHQPCSCLPRIAAACHESHNQERRSCPKAKRPTLQTSKCLAQTARKRCPPGSPRTSKSNRMERRRVPQPHTGLYIEPLRQQDQVSAKVFSESSAACDCQACASIVDAKLFWQLLKKATRSARLRTQMAKSTLPKRMGEPKSRPSKASHSGGKRSPEVLPTRPHCWKDSGPRLYYIYIYISRFYIPRCSQRLDFLWIR